MNDQLRRDIEALANGACPPGTSVTLNVSRGRVKTVQKVERFDLGELETLLGQDWTGTLRLKADEDGALYVERCEQYRPAADYGVPVDLTEQGR